MHWGPSAWVGNSNRQLNLGTETSNAHPAKTHWLLVSSLTRPGADIALGYSRRIGPVA